jgi:two-component system, NarL family, nitrate/nitrite response regulator NarL
VDSHQTHRHYHPEWLTKIVNCYKKVAVLSTPSAKARYGIRVLGGATPSIARLIEFHRLLGGTSVDTVQTYIIDKSKLFREGLRRLLPDREFPVCGEASSLEEAAADVAKRRPQVVLLEYPYGFQGGRQLDILAHEGGRPKVVVLAEKLSGEWLRRSLGAGIDGFLLKDLSSTALLQSLRLVLTGEKVFPSELAPLLIEGQVLGGEEHDTAGDLKSLSARELHVLQALVHGYSNKVIARDLKIAEATVKVHLKSVLKKLNVRNRTQAAVWALNSGLSLAGDEGLTTEGLAVPIPAASQAALQAPMNGSVRNHS